MLSLSVYLQGLAVAVAAATLAWVVSVFKHNVGIVDSLWSLLFLLLTGLYAGTSGMPGPRAGFLMTLVAVWALRLSGYITWRNWGQGEDRRYQAIRARNEPRFAVKSLWLVFWLQAVLAWIISLPLLGAVSSRQAWGWADGFGAALWLIGFIFEAGGDWQLALFKADPRNRGQVMDRGFWRLTRHPNYFGDFTIWWGFYVIAAGSGAWWSVPGPILMSVLLMRVSGVTLLEQDIGERRPAYADYVRRTNAFFPGLPRQHKDDTQSAHQEKRPPQGPF